MSCSRTQHVAPSGDRIPEDLSIRSSTLYDQATSLPRKTVYVKSKNRNNSLILRFLSPHNVNKVLILLQHVRTQHMLTTRTRSQ